MDKITKLLKDTISAQDNTHYQDILVELRNTQITNKYLYQECKRLKEQLELIQNKLNY